jgi:hypothetical protein
MPWGKIWPKEFTAYIRITPRPDPELEDDESVSCYTYIYEDRVVHIWEASDYDYPEQEEKMKLPERKSFGNASARRQIGFIVIQTAHALETAK